MASEDKVKKALCPDCGIENDAVSEECSGCKLDLRSYGAFRRYNQVYEKERQAEAAEKAEKEKRERAAKKPDGFFDVLKGKKHA